MTDHPFRDTAVVGACGKMGRGIALLLLQEMGKSALDQKERAKEFHLKLVDANGNGFYELKSYLRLHLVKYAEKNINVLREMAKSRTDLISNEEVIDAFVEGALQIVDCSTEIGHVKNAEQIFEAAFEEIPLKVELLKSIGAVNPKAWVYTNTSSIPIGLLANKSGLKDRLIGLHFYNPPPIQRLLEIIPSKESAPKLIESSHAIASRFNKIAVTSADVAGFIGNGHFAREIQFACALTRELSKDYTQEKAMEIVDTVTREFLLRPMGIFNLLDYVGLPIAHHIFGIMSEHIPDKELKEPLMEELLKAGLKGGQTLEGEPKEGIFRYEGGKPVAIYSFSKKGYVPLSTPDLGRLPIELSWKKIQKDKKLQDQFPEYFDKLFASDEMGCQLAKRFLEKSASIVEHLVTTHVAKSYEDVATVLKNGFFHLYSPYDILKQHLAEKKR